MEGWVIERRGMDGGMDERRREDGRMMNDGWTGDQDGLKTESWRAGWMNRLRGGDGGSMNGRVMEGGWMDGCREDEWMDG